MKITQSNRERLRNARIDIGLSPEQLGAEVGLSGMTIRRLEDGRQKGTTPRSAFKLSTRLDIPVRELFEI